MDKYKNNVLLKMKFILINDRSKISVSTSIIWHMWYITLHTKQILINLERKIFENNTANMIIN